MRRRRSISRFAGSWPEDVDVAGRPLAVALEDLGGGGLAGAVRTEQREHLAAIHVDVDPLDGLEVAVGLAQSADVDHPVAHAVTL